MTLDEAIEHCKEVAEKVRCTNGKCSLEHLQLAKWLMELREYRRKDDDEML